MNLPAAGLTRNSELEPKPRKYRNKIVKAEGQTFHSQKEYKRWCYLKTLLNGGAIRNLRRQVPYELIVNDVRVSRYTADFVYEAVGQEIVEDVKSEATCQDRAYRMRKRLMKAIYGIEIQEV